MLDISSDVSTGAVEHARDSLKTIGVWTVLTMVGLFLVEYPLIWMNDRKIALMDFIAESIHYGDNRPSEFLLERKNPSTLR